VWAALVGASVRAQMQYRANFVLRSFLDSLVMVTDFAPVWMLSRQFGLIDGWSLGELALLYGLVAVSWGIVEGALMGFEDFTTYLRMGEVDRWLLRPRPVGLQVAAHRFELRKLGRILQGALVLGFALSLLGPSAGDLLWVAASIGGGVLFFAGAVAAGAALQFWTLGHTSELQNALTYGGTAALSYPVSAYSGWFRRAITYGVPLAFVNYFPALAILDRTDAAGFPAWMPWLSPFACLAFLLVGLRLFAAGLRRYESTGS
jgi:ABC-2 type transport system permease protein